MRRLIGSLLVLASVAGCGGGGGAGNAPATATPVPAPSVAATSAVLRGTVQAGAAVTVNGLVATVSGTSWICEVPLNGPATTCAVVATVAGAVVARHEMTITR